MRTTSLLLALTTLLPLALSASAPNGGEAIYARAPKEDSEITTTSTQIVYVTITQTEEGAQGYSTAYITPTPKPQQFYGGSYGNDTTTDDEHDDGYGEDDEEEEMISYPSGTATWTTVVGGANSTTISGGVTPKPTDEEGAAGRIVASLGCMVTVAAVGLLMAL